MATDIHVYNQAQSDAERVICDELLRIIETHFKKLEGKIWHRHPVWFLDGNPVVGYSKLKAGIRLMFWSGADFGEVGLVPGPVSSRMRVSRIPMLVRWWKKM